MIFKDCGGKQLLSDKPPSSPTIYLGSKAVGTCVLDESGSTSSSSGSKSSEGTSRNIGQIETLPQDILKKLQELESVGEVDADKLIIDICKYDPSCVMREVNLKYQEYITNKVAQQGKPKYTTSSMQ